MTSPSAYNLGNNFECLRNDQCWSGYCKGRRCANPQRLHDPCRTAARNCPGSLKCSNFSRTCVSEHFRPSRAFCRTTSDCRFNEFCLNDTCKASRPIGSNCDSVSPDFCAMGSKCTVSKSISEPTKCYELCSINVACPEGFQCIKNVWNADSICIRRSSTKIRILSKSGVVELVYGGLLIVVAVIIFLCMIYGWIRFTNSREDDPRLINSITGKKKKKKLRLFHNGNGLATITVIPSNCQSPQPVAASQLFVNLYNSNNYPDAPPEYSEAITIQ